MKKVLLLLILFLALVQPVYALNPIYAKINFYRSAALHIPKLKVSATLAKKAQAVANKLTTSLNHSGYPLEIIGWNRGFKDPRTSIVNAWKRSPAHARIMRCKCKYFGVGESKRGNTWYFVVWFK